MVRTWTRRIALQLAILIVGQAAIWGAELDASPRVCCKFAGIGHGGREQSSYHSAISNPHDSIGGTSMLYPNIIPFIFSNAEYTTKRPAVRLCNSSEFPLGIDV